MTFVSELAAQLLSCFDQALQDGPNPPPDEKICFRVGEVPFSIGTNEDECCSGMAWVRVVRIYPSKQFPSQDTTVDNCGTLGRAIEFELGAIRCLPFGDESAGATCDQWTAVFLQVDEDAASMRRAVCCMVSLLDPGALLFEGEWSPIDGQGGCIGGKMTVTVSTDCGDCNG